MTTCAEEALPPPRVFACYTWDCHELPPGARRTTPGDRVLSPRGVISAIPRSTKPLLRGARESRPDREGHTPQGRRAKSKVPKFHQKRTLDGTLDFGVVISSVCTSRAFVSVCYEGNSGKSKYAKICPSLLKCCCNCFKRWTLPKSAGSRPSAPLGKVKPRVGGGQTLRWGRPLPP